MTALLSRLLLGLALLLAAPALAQQPVADEEATERVNEYMEALWRVRGYGGSVLVARGGRILVNRGYGLADAEHGVPNRPETVYRIGSLTKAFTAAAILLLQERGRLSVQDSLCRHIDPCPATWRPVTLHHLLTHSSGIPNVTELPDWEALKTVPAPPARLVERFRSLPLRFVPGARYEYSNSNYLLLGLAIERVSGRSYETYLQQAVLTPLGLANTAYDHPEPIVPNRAAGYSRAPQGIVNAPYIDMRMPFAAGGLRSTTGDLHRWVEALRAPGPLSRRSLEAMFAPFRGGYAYGWVVGELFGRRHFGHTGGIEGFSSHISHFPAEGATVIVLSNNDAAVADAIARDLAAILFGQTYQLPREPQAAAVDPSLYDAYAGRYQIAPGRVLVVARDSDRLTIANPPHPPAELFPESETRFFMRVADATVSFVRGEGGRVTGLILHQNGEDIPARKFD